MKEHPILFSAPMKRRSKYYRMIKLKMMRHKTLFDHIWLWQGALRSKRKEKPNE